MSKDVSKILAIAEPIAAERGLEVLDIELAGSGTRQLVRVLLDGQDEGRPVSLEDCEAVSRRLGDALEAYEAVRGHYMLEVSSPGVNRPLKRPEHFRRVVGRKIRVKTKGEIGARRNFLGRLEEAGDDGLQMRDETDTVVAIEYVDIDKANLEFEFEQKPGRPRRR